MKTTAMHIGGFLLAAILLVNPSASVCAGDLASAGSVGRARHKLAGQRMTRATDLREARLYRENFVLPPDADATSTWNAAVSGNWNDPTKWSTNPNYPNNGNGGVATYAAVVSATGAAYTITLAVPITVES